jgi:hypothetical protein
LTLILFYYYYIAIVISRGSKAGNRDGGWETVGVTLTFTEKISGAVGKKKQRRRSAMLSLCICCAEEMGQKLRISRHGEERRKGEKETEKENKGTKRKGYGE